MCDPVGFVTDFLSDVGGAISNFVDRILDDPLPVIATVALNAVGVPAYISSPAITAIRGGSMEDMALSMAAGYVGGELSAGFTSEVFGDLPIEIAPEMASTASRELFQTVLTNASPGALVAAARGASFENILEGAVSGAVSGLVGRQIQTELGLDPSQISGKILGNTINAATRAILNGQDPSSAIGASLANSALGTAVNTATGELRSTLRNIETTGNQYQEQVESANNFIEEVLEPQRNWLVENQNELQSSIDNFETFRGNILNAVDIYNTAQQAASFSRSAPSTSSLFSEDSPTYELAKKLGYTPVPAPENWLGFRYVKDGSKDLIPMRRSIYDRDNNLYLNEVANNQLNYVRENAPTLEQQGAELTERLDDFNQTNQEFQKNLAKHQGLVASADQYKATLDSLLSTRDQQASNVNDLVNQVFSTGLILGKDVAEDISGKTISLLDEATVSPEEAMRAFESAGYTPTQEELARFLGERLEAAAFQDIQDYVEAENARQRAADQTRIADEERQLYENEQARLLREEQDRIAAEEQQLIENESARQEADTIGQIAQEERDLIESDRVRQELDYGEQAGQDLAGAQDNFIESGVNLVGGTGGTGGAGGAKPTGGAPTGTQGGTAPGSAVQSQQLDPLSFLGLLGLMGGQQQRPPPPQYQVAKEVPVVPFEQMFTPYSAQRSTTNEDLLKFLRG